ncbi:reticulon-1a isoform X1 [Archocentrus centrarchus]|uniref:reticulon-1a isoform X1 n=1 Tax=Archocentrus centrarchus TaxID=63155 RepID=UPI0011EA4A12|nr:reticulon-1 isoform X1 [Archocentrus centrarchus]XP_030574591.1 reticulon-1 isoform X1 [Archocentrus centrarchus]
MSAQPGEEWFGDDYERNGLFGNTSTRFGELREEFKPRGDALGDLDQQFHPFQDDAKRPPVAMETASTDDPMSGLFRKPMNDDGDVYTSLLSNQSFTTGQEASYLSDDLKPSSHSSGSSTLDHFSSDTYSFSSKMTSSQASDTPKSLLGSDKTESYNYMDISHGDERHDQQQGVLHGLLDKSSAGHDLLGSYIDKNPGGDEDDEENLGPALGSHSFPYVEEPSDEELGDYRSYRNLGDTPQSASPVKITLTESQPTATKTEPPPHSVNASERESVLSVGLQGVPTVTLSEPEDDSPASTPNASPTKKDFPSHDMFKSDAVKPAVSKSSPGTKAGGREHDGSSAESGDSEIELVSEELPKASSNLFAQSPKSKGTFSQPNNPFDSPLVAKGGLGLAGSHAPPTAYSILREEREAELDSDLFIESASEESPKREQGFSGPKQGVSPPSPLIPSAVPPRSTTEVAPVEPLVSEKIKNPVKTDEDRPSKPKPPTAAVPPEVRSEKPHQEDMHKITSEGKGDLGKPAVPTFLEGFNKQKAIDLLYWRNVKQSGAVFSSVLLLLFSLTQFSVVSVGAYLALAALSATISFRIYKSVLQAVQKTDEGHPFKGYLEMEIALSQDQISKYADKILLYTNTCMKELRRLFLVQDLVDSLKFAVLMWLLTYVGALFNGLTLLILAVVSMFTLPVVYEKHQAQIDQYVGLIRTHVNSVVGKIQAKIPGAKRKEE